MSQLNASLLSTLSLFFLLLLPPPAHAEKRSVLVLGDSLSAAYGLAADQGWVSIIDARLRREFPDWRIVNASVSGETTAGGASRIQSELDRHSPGIVIIELGANDGLRGLPLEDARGNLQRMIVAIQRSGADAALLGMRLPPNYGPDYAQGFEALYRSLASKNDLPLLPFLLEPIATRRDAFQPDNLHPTAAVQPLIADHVWPLLANLVNAKQAAEPATESAEALP